MTRTQSLRWILPIILAAVSLLPVLGQADRGKAELKAGGGIIAVEYGRPQLKGRDPLTWQKDGSFWRMGMNETTTLTTPVDLMFGSTRITKGNYSVWLLKVSGDRFELVINSLVEKHGMTHDAAKDIAKMPMKKEQQSDSVELFTIELKSTANGGTFSMVWGTHRLSADFQLAK